MVGGDELGNRNPLHGSRDVVTPLLCYCAIKIKLNKCNGADCSRRRMGRAGGGVWLEKVPWAQKAGPLEEPAQLWKQAQQL